MNKKDHFEDVFPARHLCWYWRGSRN